MSEIYFQDVGKTYGKEAALHEVNVAFVDGVFCCLAKSVSDGERALAAVPTGCWREAGGECGTSGNDRGRR